MICDVNINRYNSSSGGTWPEGYVVFPLSPIWEIQYLVFTLHLPVFLVQFLQVSCNIKTVYLPNIRLSKKMTSLSGQVRPLLLITFPFFFEIILILTYLIKVISISHFCCPSSHFFLFSLFNRSCNYLVVKNSFYVFNLRNGFTFIAYVSAPHLKKKTSLKYGFV